MAKFNGCKNFLIEGKCEKWIIDHFKLGKHADGVDQMGKTASEEAEEICAACENFDRKGKQEVLSGTHQLFMKGKIISSWSQTRSAPFCSPFSFSGKGATLICDPV